MGFTSYINSDPKNVYFFLLMISIPLLFFSFVFALSTCCGSMEHLLPLGIHLVFSVIAFLSFIIIIYALAMLFLGTEVYFKHLIFKKGPLIHQKSRKNNIIFSPVNSITDLQNYDGNTCFYQAKYYDYQKEQLLDFYCDEQIQDRGYCAFHAEQEVEEKSLLDNSLNEKINRLIDNRQEVFCIGYRINYLSVKGKTIYKPLYFYDAKIKIADFTDTVFVAEEAIPYFVNTRFEEASFENVQFHGKAIFTNSVFFRHNSTREGYLYKWGEDYDLSNNYSGYANFNNAEFHSFANFYGSTFYGLAQFKDAKFFGNAQFRNSIFLVIQVSLPLDDASFYGKLYNKGVYLSDAYIGCQGCG